MIVDTYLLRSLLWPLFIIVLLELVLKGIALYKAGNRGDIARFICLFLINTGGILPLVYLLVTNEKAEKIELSTDKNNTKEIKNINSKKSAQTKTKNEKGGKKPGENATLTKKGKEVSNATSKKEGKKVTKKK